MEKKSHKTLLNYNKNIDMVAGSSPFFNNETDASVIPFAGVPTSMMSQQQTPVHYGKQYRGLASSSQQQQQHPQAQPQQQQQQRQYHQHSSHNNSNNNNNSTELKNTINAPSSGKGTTAAGTIVMATIMVAGTDKTIVNTTPLYDNPSIAAPGGDAAAAAMANNNIIKAQRSKNEEAILDLRQRIPEIENIFDVLSRIGSGTFSSVLLGTLKKERELPEHLRRKFAIKHHIPTSHPDRIMKELQCMAKIGGINNVVGINCCIRNNESVAFIMPYMQHDRFHDFFNKMELLEVQYYMKNLLIALRHVHKFNVIHRDVKPSNFLYNRRKRQFLLVDFGLAQQVPTPQLSGGATYGNLVAPASQQIAASMEGKRLREHDEHAALNAGAAGSAGGGKSSMDAYTMMGGDVSGAAKRIRCNEPQVDGQSTQTPYARVANSCIVSGNSNFKMPLKQLNEIMTPAKMSAANMAGNGNVAACAVSNSNNSIYETPISRQVKSAMQCGSANTRIHSKLRSQQMAGGGNGSVVTSGGGSPHDGSAAGVAASKYNTNRNHNANSQSASKCYCYGNPQVCNICLIKKEIHASRAGTPGYRPPEVLLKYPDQTTSVDVWAAGVIFLSILSSVYPFFKAPNDFVALAEMVTIFGDKTIRKTAFVLDRLVSLSQKTKPLDLRKLCVRFRNRTKFSSPELLKKYQRADGSCEVCKNCDQFYFNCLCTDTNYKTEPLDADDLFPSSAYDLLYKLLEVNPHDRITAEEALKHPFFSETLELASSNNTSQKKRP